MNTCNFVISVLTFIVSLTAMAKEEIIVSDRLLGRPEIGIECKSNYFTAISDLGLKTVNIVPKITDEIVSIKITNELLACTKNGKKMAWKKVNPFKGYDLNFLIPETKTISTRHEEINSANEGSRFELRIFDSKNKSLKLANMHEAKFDQFSGTVEYQLNEFFTEHELDLINGGFEVPKTLEVFYRSNFVRTANGASYQADDDIWSTRMLTLVFSKQDIIVDSHLK